MGSAAIPHGRVFSPAYAGRMAHVDKDSREALQVAKELTAKFIETRTVSPGNFAEIFPAVYDVVARAIAGSAQSGACREADDSPRTARKDAPAAPGDRE